MARPVRIVIVGDATGLSRTLGKANTELDAFGARAQRVSRRMVTTGENVATAGKKMSKAVTLPILAVGAASAKLAVDFQSKMNLLVTAAGDTQKNMKVISDGVLGVARDTGMSTEQLADGAYIVDKSLTRMGASSKRAGAAVDILRAAAEGATSEGVDMQTMTKALTTIMTDYGKSLGNPTKAMNALVALGGESKDTMQNIAGSLANVLPQASAVGLSFAQVGGAIATMTQHGTSAQRATDDLANTIRNMVGPNRVAQTEMQQLGINVVDLEKNVGKRGLTGTFDILTNAIKQHFGPQGLVLLDTFRKQKSAAQDAKMMLAGMTPAARKLSLEYKNGTITLGDWIKANKALDPQSANQNRQYKTLVDRLRGFNQQLRQGDPDQQAAVDALKKMVGGSTALNTILMLTGNNAKEFSSRVGGIGKQAKDTGKNISTWTSTQATAKVQLNQLKETLVTAAVKLGTGLIPALKAAADAASPFIDWIARMAQKFADASPQTQKMIVKFALLAAAIGPVVRIIGSLISTTGRLIGAGATMARWSYAAVTYCARVVQGFRSAAVAQSAFSGSAGTLGGKLRTLFSTLGTAAVGFGRYVGTAFKNAGSALAGIPTAMRGASGVAGKLGAIGAGAAAAGSALGPLAVGVLGVTAAVVGGVAVWDHYRAKQAAAKADIQSLTQAIEADNYAIGANTRATVANDLQRKGAFDAAAKLGVSIRDVTSATLGNVAAQKRLEEQLFNAGIAYSAVASATGGNTQAQTDSGRAYKKLRDVLKEEGVQLDSAKSKSGQMRAAMGQQASATDHAASAAERLDTAMQKLSGHLSATTALDQFRQAVGQVRSELDKHSHSLDGNSHAAVQNRLALAGAVQQALSYGEALKEQGASGPKVAAGIRSQIQYLIAHAKQMGLNRQQVLSYLSAQNLLPRQIITTILTKDEQAKAEVATLRRQLDSLPRSIGISVNAVGQIAVKGGGRYASGGTVPGTGNGDTVPAMLTPGEEVIRKGPAQRFRPLLKAINSGNVRGVQFFASGGTVKPPAITHQGKDWVFDGTHYASRRAAENAQTRWKKAHSKNGVALSGDEGNLGSSVATATTTADQLKSKTDKLVSDAQKFGASKAFLAHLRGETAELLKQAKVRDKLNAQIDKASAKVKDLQSKYAEMRNGIRDVVRGTFDITQASTSHSGTVYTAVGANGKLTKSAGATGTGILATLKAKVAAAKQWAANLATLRKRGVSADLLNQLAQAGPENGAGAMKELLGYSRKQVLDLDKQEALLTKYGTQAGTTVAGATYGSSIARAASDLNKLLRKRTTVTALMNAVVRELEHQIGHSLGVKPPATHHSKKRPAPTSGLKKGSGGKKKKGAGKKHHIEVNMYGSKATPRAVANELSYALKTSGR